MTNDLEFGASVGRIVAVSSASNPDVEYVSEEYFRLSRNLVAEIAQEDFSPQRQLIMVAVRRSAAQNQRILQNAFKRIMEKFNIFEDGLCQILRDPKLLTRHADFITAERHLETDLGRALYEFDHADAARGLISQKSMGYVDIGRLTNIGIGHSLVGFPIDLMKKDAPRQMIYHLLKSSNGQWQSDLFLERFQRDYNSPTPHYSVIGAVAASKNLGFSLPQIKRLIHDIEENPRNYIIEVLKNQIAIGKVIKEAARAKF